MGPPVGGVLVVWVAAMDVDAYVLAGAEIPAAVAALPSLVTNHEGYRTQNGLKAKPSPGLRRCTDGYYYQRASDKHKVWCWRWGPCNKWGCICCHRHRLNNELVPEIAEALKWAREVGETLKFLTLTWQGQDVGAQPSADGRKRRRLDQQHLSQWFRRDRDETFEYLRAAETHKSGRIHHHLVAVMPYVRQAELSGKWKDFARGSFKVDIRAVGVKCPRCYPVGRGASDKERRRSMVIPPPGRGECLCCGYAPDWSDPSVWEEVARSVAWEIGKYLTKQPKVAGVDGIIKRLTRSKAWAARCQVRLEKRDAGPCACCGEKHIVRVARVHDMAGGAEVHLDWAVSKDVAFHAVGAEPCECFTPERWFEGGIAPAPADKFVDWGDIAGCEIVEVEQGRFEWDAWVRASRVV